MVHVNGRLYSMSYHPFRVSAYDVATSSWWEILPPMKRYLRSPILVESGTGMLLLVAAIEKRTLIVPKSLRIWSLQGDGATWVEMDRMPQLLYDPFRAEMEQCGNEFHCVGHGEFIAFMVPEMGHLGLLFDMFSKRWRCIPPCPYVGMAGLDRSLAYEPQLATPVTSLLNYQFSATPFQA